MDISESADIEIVITIRIQTKNLSVKVKIFFNRTVTEHFQVVNVGPKATTFTE